MYVLVGGNGYVGSAFRQLLEGQALPFENLSRSSVDYYDRSELTTVLKSLKPEFLINAAGFTGRPNVDACELQKTQCLVGNSVLPGVLRDVCEDLNLPWGHVSSGCIFTGRREDGAGFTENDAPNFSFRQDNCSFYSGCKALGEEVLTDATKCYIWRLRIPFEHIDSNRNYLSKMMRYERLLNAENSLSHLNDFVASSLACHTMGVDYGIYNLTNPGAVTTKQVVSMLEKFGVTSQSFSFFEDEDEFMALAAKTPRSNCVLDSSKAIQTGLPLRPVEEALEESLQNWVPETADA